MPPSRRRSAATPDPAALASLSEVAPRLTRSPDVDPVLGTGGTLAERASAAPMPTPSTKTAQPQGEGATRFGAYIKASVAEDVRDAVVALGGNWTIGALMEQALVREVQRLAEENNDGQPFPQRGGRRLRPGPRIQ
jgi:hypothetical protein